MSDYDGFGDLVDDDFGNLGGTAVDHLRRARTTPTPAGLVIEMACGSCGRSIALTLNWPEVISLKYGLSPDRWMRPAGGDTIVGWTFGAERNQSGQQVGGPMWSPNLQCQCGGHYPLRVKPDEPESWLRVARSSRMLPQQLEHNVSLQAAQVAQQAAGGAAPQPQPQLPARRR